MIQRKKVQDKDFKTKAAIPDAGRATYIRKAKDRVIMTKYKPSGEQAGSGGANSLADVQKELEKTRRQLAAD